MTAQRSSLRFTRAAALLSIPALAFVLSTSAADAHSACAHRHGHGHGHGHGHAGVVRVAGPSYAVRAVVAPPAVVRRVCAPYPAYAPYPPYAPYPAYAAPVVRPCPAAPAPYGHIGIAGPNFSFGIAF